MKHNQRQTRSQHHTYPEPRGIREMDVWRSVFVFPIEFGTAKSEDDDIAISSGGGMWPWCLRPLTANGNGNRPPEKEEEKNAWGTLDYLCVEAFDPPSYPFLTPSMNSNSSSPWRTGRFHSMPNLTVLELSSSTTAPLGELTSEMRNLKVLKFCAIWIGSDSEGRAFPHLNVEGQLPKGGPRAVWRFVSELKTFLSRKDTDLGSLEKMEVQWQIAKDREIVEAVKVGTCLLDGCANSKGRKVEIIGRVYVCTFAFFSLI
jgi:hypothetical protein